MDSTDTVIELDRLREHYEGKWVGGEVVERNADQTPKKLRVLVHSSDESVVWDRLSGMREACVLYVGDLVPEGQEAFF